MSLLDYMCYHCEYEYDERCNVGRRQTYLQKNGRCPGANGEEGLFGMKLPKYKPKGADKTHEQVST